MSKEYFWGDELSGSKKEIKWNPSFEDDDDDDIDIDGIQHFLFLKQAVLGVDAKEGERNVVEISTENFEGDDVKQPLFSLKLGLNESSILDIAVQPPVTLSLVGSGPVYLSGQHMIEINAEDEDEEDELEEEEFYTKALPDNAITKNKKRPLSTSESVAKKMKMSKEDQDDDEDEEEEDEEMPVMEELDDDDEEDDEDFEGEEEDEDEEDSDDDEEEEEEEEEEEDGDEEEEESPAKPVKKVKGMKGKMNGTATAKGDNKLKTKEATNSVTKSKGKKKTFGLDEIKKKLQESSGLPKKEERFKNYIRSTFHMSDSKKLSDVWGWYRASLQK